MTKAEYDVKCREMITALIKLNDIYLNARTINEKNSKLEALLRLRREFSDLVTSFHPDTIPLIKDISE